MLTKTVSNFQKGSPNDELELINPLEVKYIALLAMVKIVPTHPHLVAVHQNDILASLEDQDLSIRMRALDLVSSMVQSNPCK